MRSRFMGLVVVVTTLILGFGAVGSADASTAHLVKFKSGPVDGHPSALVGYSTVAGGDAPGSPQPKALRLETGPNPASDGSFSYAGVEAVGTPTNGKALTDVNRINYKFRGYSGAGAPRISLVLSTGHVIYLSGFYCNKDLTPTAWKQTRFFGAVAGCTIYSTNGGFTSDGVTSAWDQVIASEGPGATITEIDVVKDETSGNDITVSWLDDIRFDGVLFAGPTVNTVSH